MTETTALFSGFDRTYLMENHPCGRTDFFANLEKGTPHRELLRGEWVPESPLEASWSMGKAEPPDIAWGQSTDWLYLSPRVQQLFSKNNLTGWTTYPIVLHNKAGVVCTGYAGLSIVGRCGPIDRQGGQLAPGESAESKFALRVGLYFDETTWDGSDFFCPAGNNSYMFATEKVKNVFEQHDIGGFEFTPLTEATWIP